MSGFIEDSLDLSEIESMNDLSDMDLLLQPPKSSKICGKHENELTKFLKNSSNDIGFEFWANHGHEYPVLFKLFKCLATIQPTSCSVERLFSKAKLVFSDIKGRMDTDTIFYNLLMN